MANHMGYFHRLYILYISQGSSNCSRGCDVCFVDSLRDMCLHQHVFCKQAFA